MQRLMDRQAIPKNRLRYFAEADYNPGKSKESRAALFLRNAGSEAEMYRHGHFALFYLSYLINGADLPMRIQEAFLATAKAPFVSVDQLVKLARKQVRELFLSRSK